MPLTPDQIANIPASELRERARKEVLGNRKPNEETFVSAQFGDGGWHTQPGKLWFDPAKIAPLGDHIVVELDPEPETDSQIVRPDVARNQERGTRLGTILKVGPGRWMDELTHKDKHMFIRLPMTLKVGDRVIVGPYSDWESWDCDYEGRGRNIAVFQERDVRLYGSPNRSRKKARP